MKKYILMILVSLLVFNVQFHAQGVTKVGTTAASFLGIDVGPRGTGMGSAYVSVTNDATALYWNPSGIASLTELQATFSNTRWIADLAFNYAGLVIPMQNYGSIGIHATFLTMDQMERTTIANPDGTGELFDAGSYAFGLSYARYLTDNFSFGITGKYISERMYNSVATGFAIDVGVLFNTNFHGVKFGMSITNYGTKMQLNGRDMLVQHDIDPSVSGNNQNMNANLETGKYDLPLLFRGGISADILQGTYNSNLILSVDALHPSDFQEYVNVGGEYVFNDMFSLRAGYRELFVDESEQGLTLGAGFRFNIAGTTKFYFDYSFIDFGVFNPVHTWSISLGL